MIYIKIRFENKDLICDAGLLKMIKINNVENIERVLKSKSFSLMINFDNDLKIDYFEIRMKLMQKFEIKSSLLSLFEKCAKIYKISKI